jgi:hypothetical protein
MSSTSAWLIISVAWLTGAFGSGYFLARLYKRLHPELSFHKLWALWTVVLSIIAVVILLIV